MNVCERMAVGMAAAATVAIGGLVPAHADPPWVVTHTYVGPAPDGELAIGGAGVGCFPADCVDIFTPPGAHHVRIELRDATGLPVGGMDWEEGMFCRSETRDTFAGDDILIEIPIGTTVGCSQATTGTIVARFSR